MLGKLIKIYLDFVRSIDFITEIIWGINVKKKLLPITYDLTSLVLKKAIKIYLKKYNFNNHLDMGCGQIAILGQFHKKINSKAEVLSADIYEDFLLNAKINSSFNNLEIKFSKTDMFNNIDKKFDLITFNPPYVPVRYKSKDLKYDKISYSGEEGTVAIEEFLKGAYKFLTKNGIILLGVNQFYVPFINLNYLIKSYGYYTIDVVKRWPHKCIVFVLKK
ncbi:methyltransferase [Candidatus Pelagibacter sp.]|nr:methyltransferase [Candidatus Pelagibacter sp.]